MNRGRGLSRRQFLWRAPWSGLALASLSGRVSHAAGRESAASVRELERLRRTFLDPPHGAKPMTRWWWFGGAVTKDEITRELGLMKQAGLRGAEIQPVYPVVVDAPERGIRNIRYFSAEWYEVLRHAVLEARRLGLQLDFTLGSGWPYGGPFIPTGLAARRLRLLTQELQGPREVEWNLSPHLTGDDRIAAVIQAPVRDDGQPDLANARVLGDQPKTEAQGARRGSWVRGIAVPEGRWRLSVVLDSPTGQQVKRPTVGMEGNVLDHHSREAMALFLRAAGDRVIDGLRPAADPPFDSVFCDSLEVYGADWTADFVAEFRTRRGYDLAPWLPALWSDSGPSTPHVRHDYHLTLSELTLERFFRPLVEWAEGKGMKARIQAHGAMGDVLQAYGLAHVPEGETIFAGDRYAVNLRHRRLASSAGHLYGKPVVSAEAYTWLRLPMYLTTLEQMKAATDAHLLDGVNQLVNHGYAYSPPEAGAPGWAFYASTEVNHNNTWWRHYPHLAAYVQRACAILREGVAVNPVAVYLPLSDVFARHGAGGLHVDVELEARMGVELFDGLRRAGYDFDLVHDHALSVGSKVEDGRLQAGTGRYRVVIVPGARWMPPESAERLLELARAGGHVLFIEALPEGAPGLAGQEARNARLARALEALRGGAGFALVPDRAAALARLASALAPDFSVIEPKPGDEAARRVAVENVGFVHRRAGAVDLYFVANVSGHEQKMRVRFDAGHRAPERWDLERGAVAAPLDYAYVKPAGRVATDVELGLGPFESCFVVFGTSTRRPPAPARAGSAAVTVPDPIPIDGPWELTLGAAAAQDLRRLVSWTELPAGRSFSGWGTYEVEFDLPASGAGTEWVLDLGTVHETAEAWLNGRPLGAAWKGRRRLACGDALRAGRNHLKIEVANLWIHHVLARPAPDLRELEETFGIRWGRYGEVKPEKVPPAGLLGPVRLLPVALNPRG